MGGNSAIWLSETPTKRGRARPAPLGFIGEGDPNKTPPGRDRDRTSAREPELGWETQKPLAEPKKPSQVLQISSLNRRPTGSLYFILFFPLLNSLSNSGHPIPLRFYLFYPISAPPNSLSNYGHPVPLIPCILSHFSPLIPYPALVTVCSLPPHEGTSHNSIINSSHQRSPKKNLKQAGIGDFGADFSSCLAQQQQSPAPARPSRAPTQIFAAFFCVYSIPKKSRSSADQWTLACKFSTLKLPARGRGRLVV